MRKIIACGEIVYDIIFKNNHPEKGIPGGSMLNTATSIGRLGLPVFFWGETGGDIIGNIIIAFLKTNNVDTRYLNQYHHNKSAIALAFLDAQRNATYTFYKDYPLERLQGIAPQIEHNDMLLFGSSFSIQPQVQDSLRKTLSWAKEKQALILYDPNVRINKSTDTEELKLRIMNNIPYADIIRASDEDLRNLGYESEHDFLPRLSENQILIITRNKRHTSLYIGGKELQFPVTPITPISTIGAGDNFNAGLIFALYKLNVSRNTIASLNTKQWETIVKIALSCAENVCMSFDNYIDIAFANTLKAESLLD